MGCWKRLSKNTGIAECLNATRPTTVIDLVSGLQIREHAKDTMDPDRRQRLEALPGWSWDVRVGAMGRGLLSSESSFQTEKVIAECLLATRPMTVIGSVSGLRVREQAKDTMDPDRRQRLEALPGWSWDVLSDQWEEGFSHLKQFSEREGHCRVPQGYKTDDGYRLGQWVGVQRTTKDTMDPDRRQRLEALPGWSWDALSDKWEEGFSHLKAVFRTRRSLPSSCNATRPTTVIDSVSGLQFREQAKDTMDPDRRQRLEALPGWSWDVLVGPMGRGLLSSESSFQTERVIAECLTGYKTDDGYRLGQWVAVQRDS